MSPGVRREIEVRGSVQGLGFRPWAARQARAFDLAGEVQNTPWGVRVVLEGPPQAVAGWLEALRKDAPKGARIDAVEERDVPCTGGGGFTIMRSIAAASGPPTRIPLDRALCDDCRDDLFDPANRRYRYPFTHCASCGPRASVLLGLPYDRERTTLRVFAMCSTCEREYNDPADRRFHAESIACPACGPRLTACRAGGEPVDGDPIETAAACLEAGGIVAVKGYGGFHLVCDATRPEVVSRLRKRKARPSKPIAVLVPDLRVARSLAQLGDKDEDWLCGEARAVVVAPRREAGAAAFEIATEVAPRTQDLGLILPVAPVHWLLLYAPAARPAADAPRYAALVFTSANRSGEPTVHDDSGVRARLSALADLVLTHDRAVARPNDDPVVRSAPGSPIPIRLSRSTSPLALRVPGRSDAAPVVLAMGGDLKAAPAVLAHGEVVLGEHVGDLANVESADAMEQRALALCQLLHATPEIVAHDLHPEYVGTEIAARLAKQLGARTVAVQHHHAHAAACLVEHGRADATLALVLDGAGWGPDRTIWGGELLRVDLAGATRLAHLEAVPLAGGDAAIREPWRMAWAWLRQAFPHGDAPRLPWHERRNSTELGVIARAVDRGLMSPLTSSCGRLFDAVASILDVGDLASHEGELAIALESLATTSASTAAFEDSTATEPGIIRVSDLVRDLVLSRAQGAALPVLARSFHVGLATRLANAASAASRATGVGDIVLSGGCLQNRLLRSELETRLTDAGLRPLVHRRIPPSDGGLAVGQAAVAARPRT